jgi:hypothetical protein
MRALPAACLWLLGLIPAAAAQEQFVDADFDFRAQLPVGMRAASDEERAAVFKLEPDKARNLPRGEAAGAAISHSYIWLDQTTPYNRQVSVALSDGLPPFKSPTELKNSQVQQGLSVEVGPNLLQQPQNAVYVEGTFQLGVEKTPMRRILLYIPDFGAKRYAVMTLQAFAADWPIVKPDFDKVVASVRMKLTKQEIGRAPLAGGKGAGKAGSSAGRRGPDTNSWSSLPVAGSLLLAAVVIGSLAFGRRKPA